jgi:hypothetical protein
MQLYVGILVGIEPKTCGYKPRQHVNQISLHILKKDIPLPLNCIIL